MTAGLALSACSLFTSPGDELPDEITTLPRALTPAEQEIVGATGAFAFDLLREVNVDWRGKNVFISPLSASMALGMTMNGTAGATFDQMRATLGFGTRPLADINAGYQGLIALLQDLDPKVTFELANAIWYDRLFEPSIEAGFLSDVRTWFDAEVGALDMGTAQSVQTINDWAKNNTNGKIDKVIDDTRDLVMLLANAIYFKGDWREQFDKDETEPRPFTLGSGSVVDVPTMHRKGKALRGSSGDALWLEMPYGGSAYAMTVVAPPEGTSIDAFTESLTADDWQQGIQGLNDYEGEILFPKFKLAWEDTLQSPLKRLGMVDAFLPHVADFTRLSSTMGRDLFVSFVKQNSFVDVNEEGTEAAAVTTVGVGPTSAPIPLWIDRPFVFALRERISGTILFVGKIVDPR
jgi:serpin B